MERQKKEFTGVWIPRHVIEDKDLSPLDKMLYAEISSFKRCYWKNTQLGERYKRSERTISEIVSRLKKKGYIKETAFNGRMRGLIALKDDKRVSPENPPCSQTAKQTRRKPLGRVEENFYADQKKTSTKDNYIDNNIDNNTCKPSLQGNQINKFMSMFEEVNPSFERLYPNRTQRASLERMIKKYPEKDLSAIIKSLSVTNCEQFAPTVTTPLQLEDKIGQLKAYWASRKSANSMIVIKDKRK